MFIWDLEPELDDFAPEDFQTNSQHVHFTIPGVDGGPFEIDEQSLLENRPLRKLVNRQGMC